MIPFPSIDSNPDQSEERGEGSSSNTNGSHATTASDKLSALPQQTGPLPRTSRNSPSSSNPRQIQRRSFDGSLLNFPSLLMSESEISPLRKLKDKFGTQSTRGVAPRISASEGNSPNRGRVSIDSDHSLPTPRIVGQPFTRLRTGSDPPLPPSALRSAAYATDGDSVSNRHFNSRSPSNSHPRAVSPLRFIQTLSASLHRHSRPEPEEPFVPINPFKSKINLDITSCLFRTKSSTPDIELTAASDSSNNTGVQDCEDVLMIASVKDFLSHAHIFVAEVLPSLIYLTLLMRLPALYFSRVARIFREAEVSRPDIERMIKAGQNCIHGFEQCNDDCYMRHQHSEITGKEGNPSGSAPPRVLPRTTAGIGMAAQIGMTPALPGQVPIVHGDERTPPIVTPTLLRFKHSWEAFIDSLLREWKTLNVVSALLASAILTIFQIPDASSDPITRTAAILSLVCALMSLTYGCMYIVRFGSMRTMVRASRWAEEARRTKTSILWNVWVLLAMPAVWLAWSMVIFMVAILSFVWRTGSESDPSERRPLSATAILGTRIAITSVVFVGLLYLALIIKTLKSYGLHGGSSRSMLSPSSRLRALSGDGQNHGHCDYTTGGRNDNVSGAAVVAMERRGRERQRSASFGRATRKREEAPERHDHTRRAALGGGLREDNELGLYPLSSSSSPLKIG